MHPISPELLLDTLVSRFHDRLTHVRTFPARPGQIRDLPDWVAPELAAALGASGVKALWSHQHDVAQAAHQRRHVIMATGTASGKSLGYLLPTLSDILTESRMGAAFPPTALYLAPTKALAADQLATIRRWDIPGLRAATYDGDTPTDERRWVRAHADYVLSNADLVHHSLLPRHHTWSVFLRRLRYVIVDECHIYRGVSGSHVAAVLRRLRRLCARYHADPTFIFASATVSDAQQQATRLLGMPVEAVTEDGAPRAAVTVGLWQPPELPTDRVPSRPGSSFARRNVLSEAADVMAELVVNGAQTVTFARSRAGVEAVALSVTRTVEGATPGAGHTIAAYRSGYLPEERRALERGLRTGRLRGLASTSALELGMDISGLDAVVIAGWPGGYASFWQQVGRAGRSGKPALAVFVADDDPLDRYLVEHPAALFDRPVEACVVDPQNPYVLTGHLVAAAAEAPLTTADQGVFGPTMLDLLPRLTSLGLLRRRPAGWYPASLGPHSDRPSLRGDSAGDSIVDFMSDPVRDSGSRSVLRSVPVRIVEDGSGRVLGTMDRSRAPATLHPGAVYLHQGQAHVAIALDLDEGTALVVAGDPGWSTTARSISTFEVRQVQRGGDLGPYRISFGAVSVRSQVTSFLRRAPNGQVLGEHSLSLPEQILDTTAVWWTCPVDTLADLGLSPQVWPGALHAAEHAAIGLLPLVAMVDRWDIGGVSTVLHPDTGMPTVMVYDGYPGGAGFAELGYQRAEEWLSATRDSIRTCRCLSGCPGCIQSPKCGNGNEPLDKAGAITVLGGLLASIPPVQHVTAP